MRRTSQQQLADLSNQIDGEAWMASNIINAVQSEIDKFEDLKFDIDFSTPSQKATAAIVYQEYKEVVSKKYFPMIVSKIKELEERISSFRIIISLLEKKSALSPQEKKAVESKIFELAVQKEKLLDQKFVLSDPDVVLSPLTPPMRGTQVSAFDVNFEMISRSSSPAFTPNVDSLEWEFNAALEDFFLRYEEFFLKAVSYHQVVEAIKVTKEIMPTIESYKMVEAAIDRVEITGTDDAIQDAREALDNFKKELTDLLENVDDTLGKIVAKRAEKPERDYARLFSPKNASDTDAQAAALLSPTGKR